MNIMKPSKNATRKLEKEQRIAPAFRKLKRRVVNPTRFRKTKHACIVEVQNPRVESTLPRNHEDHIADKGYNSMPHHDLVHKFIPVPQEMNIFGCESSSRQGMKKARKVASMASCRK